MTIPGYIPNSGTLQILNQYATNLSHIPSWNAHIFQLKNPVGSANHMIELVLHAFGTSNTVLRILLAVLVFDAVVFTIQIFYILLFDDINLRYLGYEELLFCWLFLVSVDHIEQKMSHLTEVT